MPTPGLGAITFAPTEPARLDEGADVLELLFRFACFDEHVNLDQAPFKVVAELAEAAQKYIVHTAIAACRVYVKYVSSTYPWRRRSDIGSGVMRRTTR